QQDRHRQRRHLLVGDHALGVRVDDPVDLLVGQYAAVALGPDDVHGREAHAPPSQSRCPGPKAPGSRSPTVVCPSSVSTKHSGPPCSHSSCRQRPHGVTGSPAPSTQETATRRPPPVRCSSLTMPHSAQRVRPKEAFSTLHPLTIRPSSTRPATPTGNFE